MATMTEPGTGTSLPAVTTSRRTGLALALAVAAAVGAALAGAGPAQAAPPACGQEYAAFYLTTADGQPPGPGDGSDSRNPRDVYVYVSVSGPARYVALSGVHRPRRPIVFTFVNQDDVVVRQYATTPSDDSGVIRPERNLIPWNYPVGTRLRVNAVIRTRCDGDDVPKSVYVGAINTVP
ncbi:hypothetical protein [Plantactinospora sp. DSM 117369]